MARNNRRMYAVALFYPSTDRGFHAARTSPLSGGGEFDMVSALYNIAIEILSSPRGKAALQTFGQIIATQLNMPETVVNEIVQAILEVLNHHSPMLVIDSTMSSELIGEWHRAPWRGHGVDRSVMKYQSISISNMWLYQVAYYQQLAPQGTGIDDFHVSAFRIVVMFLHEISHLIVNWALHASLAGSDLGQFPEHERACLGELLHTAGERMEFLMFKGQVEFYTDWPVGSGKRYAWTCSDKTSRAHRLDNASLRYVMVNSGSHRLGYDIVNMLPNPCDIIRPDPDARHFLCGLPRREGRIVNRSQRDRTWEHQERIWCVSHQGKDYFRRYLREVVLGFR